MKHYDPKSFHPGNSLPCHAGLIPDGTRRWALANKVPPADAYIQAVGLLGKIVVCLLEEGISEISIYLSSEQNFRRTGEEVDAFCRAEAYFCETLLGNIAETYDLRAVPVGNMGIIPGYLRESLEVVTKMTDGNAAGRINLCVAYNPLDELFAASRHAADGADLLQNLWVKNPLDFVIRTGDANLLSNFLPMQSGFARLYFLEKLFNDVEEEEIRHIARSFRHMTRMYGE